MDSQTQFWSDLKTIFSHANEVWSTYLRGQVINYVWLTNKLFITVGGKCFLSDRNQKKTANFFQDVTRGIFLQSKWEVDACSDYIRVIKCLL